jgi:hypothetical protein
MKKLLRKLNKKHWQEQDRLGNLKEELHEQFLKVKAIKQEEIDSKEKEYLGIFGNKKEFNFMGMKFVPFCLRTPTVQYKSGSTYYEGSEVDVVKYVFGEYGSYKVNDTVVYVSGAFTLMCFYYKDGYLHIQEFVGEDQIDAVIINKNR